MHHDYTHKPTPISGVPVEIDEDAEKSTTIGPSSKVSMSLRNFVGLLVLAVTLLSGLGTGYFALASTDKDNANKIGALQEQIKGVVTKQDLQAFRYGLREDLQNATWLCRPGGNGTLECSVKLPRVAP
jgi:hypothetical protein